MSLPPLINHIAGRIRSSGPVDFSWFMEQALYHPEWGYYSSGRARIGKAGDFFTNVSVGRLWAELLVEQLRQLWISVGSPSPFVVIEQGANDGTLAADILDIAPAELRDAVQYLIVEPFPLIRGIQRERLARHPGKVEWHQSPGEITACCGVHISNELLDAMPVQLVRYEQEAWHLLRVDLIDDSFTLVTAGEIEHPALPKAAAEGYTTELHHGIEPWLRSVSTVIEQGYVLIFDYGHYQDDYYAPFRSTGTLRGYKDHQRSDNPFTDIGEKDLTAHVNWSEVERAAAATGFAVGKFTDQTHFVVEMGKEIFADTDASPSPSEQQRRRQFLTLMHPTLMGRSFQVMCLKR